MKIQYCSDLHLEFPENKEFLTINPLHVKGDILLLAGDIVPFIVKDEHKEFFDYLSDNFKYTYWVPGNHEYYHIDIMDKSGAFNEKIRNNVFLISNTSVILDKVKFIFSTLWSQIRTAYQWQIERGFSDFHVIKYNGNRLSAEKYNLLHEESLNFIKQELTEKKENKTVVVSHHVPTFLNYPEKYKGSVLNDAFGVELIELIKTKGPDYWVFGHHHQNVTGFQVGKTKLITNQLGYVKYGEHKLFKEDKIFKL